MKISQKSNNRYPRLKINTQHKRPKTEHLTKTETKITANITQQNTPKNNPSIKKNENKENHKHPRNTIHPPHNSPEDPPINQLEPAPPTTTQTRTHRIQADPEEHLQPMI